MKGFVDGIKDLTLENAAFRRVRYTGKHLQLVLIALKPNEEIGAETHVGHDQSFRAEKGKREVWIDGKRSKISGMRRSSCRPARATTLSILGRGRSSCTRSMRRLDTVTAWSTQPRPTPRPVMSTLTADDGIAVVGEIHTSSRL